MTDLVVYGDFNCPFSALASARVDALERAGKASVQWRAIEHATDVPSGGVVVEGDLEAMFASELDQIRGLLHPGEPDRLRIPARQVNTAAATRRYAGTSTDSRAALRRDLFAAHWERGEAIDDESVLDGLGAGPADPSTAEQWRTAWLAAVAKPIVPLLIMADGYASRGLGALGRLAGMLDGGGGGG